MICPNCESKNLLPISGGGSGIVELPAWRCKPCNLKFVVTNPHALPTLVWREHPVHIRRAEAYRLSNRESTKNG